METPGLSTREAQPVSHGQLQGDFDVKNALSLRKRVPPSQQGGAWELIRVAREKQPLESGEEKGKEGQDW